MPSSSPAEGASFPVSPTRHSMPVWYPDLLDSVSNRITVGRLRVTVAVNNELIATYFLQTNRVMTVRPLLRPPGRHRGIS